MYFSRVRIKNNSDGLKLFLDLQSNGSYSAHQILWGLFRNVSHRSFIFRQDPITSPGDYLALEYLTVSSIPPFTNQGCIDIETKRYDPEVKSGDVFEFHLRANPTISRTVNSNNRSRIHDVMMDAKSKYSAEERKTNPHGVNSAMEKAATSWLTSEDRSNRYGYQINEVIVSSQIRHEISQVKSINNIFYTAVDYRGILTVKDPERFRTLLFNGTGKAKAFGCGLITIRRVNSWHLCL